MQTSLDPEFAQTDDGRLAEQILRKCVHCGFCNATCPTYELLGDELDGPRGRIYQIKQLLEEGSASKEMQLHLDRCLLCRACETTCPSGVEYSKLLEVGRKVLEQRQPRPVAERIQRKLVRELITSDRVFDGLLQAGRSVRAVLPPSIAAKIPAAQAAPDLQWPAPKHGRKMVTIAGCAQPAMTPATNLAAANVLDRLGISLVELPGRPCCGAVHLHTSGTEKGVQAAKAMIDACEAHLDQGAEGIVMTASGCGVTVKDYDHLLQHDPDYADRARRVSEYCLDLSEVVAAEMQDDPVTTAPYRRVAIHLPCTLQHDQKIAGKIESILSRAGYELVPVRDAHLCCGSAGTYSMFQPEISARLKDDKQAALQENRPDVICTANVGCQVHLAEGSEVPVRHWIELLL